MWAQRNLEGFSEEGPFGLELEDREVRGEGEIPSKDCSLFEAQKHVREGLRGVLRSWSILLSLGDPRPWVGVKGNCSSPPSRPSCPRNDLMASMPQGPLS